MELENITIMDYVLDEYESIVEVHDADYFKNVDYIRFLFTSQGLDKTLYLDFEVAFPELCHDSSKLIKFLGSDEGHKQVGYFLRKNYYLNKAYYRRPTRLLSDEFDKDDYERSQRISEIPFHI